MPRIRRKTRTYSRDHGKIFSRRTTSAPHQPAYRSLAPELIFDADNVVLTEIRSRLHFDQFKNDLARICQSVGTAQREIDGLIFGKDLYLSINGHLAGALNDNPML